MAETLTELARRLAEINKQIVELQRTEPATFTASNAVLPDADQARYEAIRTLREEAEDIADMLESPPEETPGAAAPIVIASAPNGLAVVVGHTQKAPGARGISPPFRDNPSTRVHEDHEYGWNSGLALMIKDFAEKHSIRCEIFKRDRIGITGAYANVRVFNPQATVELHFNSNSTPARGTETLYGHAASKPWSQALQNQMVKLYGRSKTNRRNHDRGLKLRDQNNRERGWRSVTQLHPSALIEPFFAHVSDDAMRGFSNKQGLAEAVVQAFAELTGITLGGQQRPTYPKECLETAATRNKPDFEEIARVYAQTNIEFPALKAITLAQWALESGWGESPLAKRHKNYAGMKAIAEVKDILEKVPAERVLYEAHDGEGWYLRFRNEADFIKGYWMFMERSPYMGWRNHTDSPEAFIRFIGEKWAVKPDYAEAVIAVKNRMEAAGEGICPQPPAATGEINLAAIPADADLFKRLHEAFEPPLPELKDLKPALFSHWALESSWGRFELATDHMNFAGMEWQPLFDDIAVRVTHPSNPAKGDFCRFLGFAGFLQGYAIRLTKDPDFAGWRGEVGSDDAFLEFLAPRWRPGNTSYLKSLKSILGRLRNTSPGGSTGTVTPGIDLDGFVVRVTREQVHKRGSKKRTAGRYEAFFDKRKIPGLEGACVEPIGPGDNTEAGINRRRIEERTYPLYTHGNDRTKYRTFGYSSGSSIGDKPRPGIGVRSTGSRSAILIHPAIGFKSTTGCLNLSRPLDKPSSDIDYADSRERVISLIDAMKLHLGGDFPSRSSQRIKDGWLLVEGEPMTVVAGATTGTEDEDLYELVAALMGEGMDADSINAQAIENLVQQGTDLSTLRDETGMNLWGAWAQGWEASFQRNDPDERKALQAQLEKIADLLDDAGVDMDDAEGLHTPLVDAAMRDSVYGVAGLSARGAGKDHYDRSGMTPLLEAAFRGAENAFNYLFYNGADASLKVRDPIPADSTNGDEPDPLDLMEAEGCPSGSDLNACAELGRSLAAGSLGLIDAYEAILSTLWKVRHTNNQPQ